MKILYHHRIASRDGQYVHVEELTRALQRRGHEIVMAAPSVAADAEFGSEGGIVSHLKRALPGWMYESAEFGYALRAYRRLVRLIRRHRPDFIYERYQLFMPAGVWAARRFGLPLLLEVNAPLYEERGRYDGIALDRLAAWSERYAWRGADHVLPVTRVLADRVRAAGVPAGRITVIPNGVDPGRFRRVPAVASAKAELGLAGRTVLGFTGFAREWHGLDKVVEVIAGRPGQPLHFLLVGDGPARPGIEARARELGVQDRITVTGIVGRDEVARHVAAFDVALQPAVVDYASPLKLFEYMVLGRAIVAPDTPNIREILSDGRDALLFDPAAPGAFRAVLERMCDEPGLRARLGAAAAQTVLARPLTWDENARRVETIASRLLAPVQVGGDRV